MHLPGSKIILGAAIALVIGVAAAVTTFAVAGGAGDSEEPITGAALERASAAALAHTGSGAVTDTEVGDEEGFYEVEVTLDDGSQVDVHLDRDFNVVSDELESPGEDEDEGEDSDD